MAIDLHTGVDTSLPYQFLAEKKLGQGVTVTLPPSRDHNHSNFINDDDSSPALKPHVLFPHDFGSNTRTSSSLPHYSAEAQQGINQEEDLDAELTRQMAHFMLQDDDKFDFSGIGSPNLESSWDSSMGSPQSTLWSPLCSNLGSPDEGSSREPSPPGNSRDSCWETTYDVVGMFDQMRLDQRRDNNSKCHHNIAYGNQNSKTSNVGTCSRQSLIQEQIRAIQLSRLKQEQILSLKQKLAAYREFESKEQIMQFQKKGASAVAFDNRCRTRIPRQQGPMLRQQQPGSEMQALYLGGSDSRGASCGTGVFLPRGRTNASSDSRKRPGKGCSNILIPARVVQALQLHFDQMAATSGPKPGGFPPLHDVLVSNRNGMYSLQKLQSRKAPASMQNGMILPQEWTY